MAKIVYNDCFGGFRLSPEAIARYMEIKGLKFDNPSPYHHGMNRIDGKYWSASDIPRNDPALVQVVEEMGYGANTHVSSLKIAEVPDGERYRINEYDGMEIVETIDTIEWGIA